MASSSPPLHHHTSHLFTPIQEGNEKDETAEQPRHRHKSRRQEKLSGARERVVSCLDCRPNAKEKTCVVIVPVDNNPTMHGTKHALTSSPSNPNTGLFKSLLAGISRRSPKSPATATPKSEEQWKELSNKLILATKKRDEAILEASRMKHSVAELEGKLTRLEIYCDNLKSGLEHCGGRISSSSYDGDSIVKNFLVWVSEARSSIRLLSKSLTSQMRLMGSKVFDNLSNTLQQSYDIKVSLPGNNPKNMLMYVEALLNSVLFEDFESVGFERNSMTRILNPIERSESNYEEFNGLKDLCWDEVLSKGTKHFSEEFSKFCDRKMSEIVAMLGWNRAWPEKLLQAFFCASKSVWLVHLLANSVHPALTIFRVDKGVRFDPVYMEDMGVEKVKKLVPIMVRIMVEPGFYVYDNVVKCKVVCRYYNSNYGVFSNNGEDNNGIRD